MCTYMAGPSRSRAKQAEKLFLKTAEQDGIDWTSPSVAGVWNAFKEFGSISFDCARTALLFECGIFAFEGRDMFDVCFVRQFTIHKDNEYDHMEQFHIRMRFAPTPELRVYKTSVWSSKFDSLGRFAEFVEGLEAFKAILRHNIPATIHIYQDSI
jgi:hypothetical protein